MWRVMRHFNPVGQDINLDEVIADLRSSLDEMKQHRDVADSRTGDLERLEAGDDESYTEETVALREMEMNEEHEVEQTEDDDLDELQVVDAHARQATHDFSRELDIGKSGDLVRRQSFLSSL